MSAPLLLVESLRPSTVKTYSSGRNILGKQLNRGFRGELSGTGCAARTFFFFRYSFRLSKACWHFLSHSNGTPFFLNLENGWHLPEKLEMNHRIYY